MAIWLNTKPTAKEMKKKKQETWIKYLLASTHAANQRKQWKRQTKNAKSYFIFNENS